MFWLYFLLKSYKSNDGLLIILLTNPDAFFFLYSSQNGTWLEPPNNLCLFTLSSYVLLIAFWKLLANLCEYLTECDTLELVLPNGF